MLRFGAAVVLLIAVHVHARVHKPVSWANTQFAAATRLQELLESKPVTERSRHDYQRVIVAYQRVYSDSPTSSKADPSVMASAQLMEEMGRQFKADDVLRSAIEQYEFLRREYPGSKARFDALFRIGEIYRDDLRDKSKADVTFQEFLHRYPHNPLAAEAKKALAEPVQQATWRSKESPKPKSQTKQADSEPKDTAETSADDSASAGDETETAKSSRVLGVRHWSTPDYTRVAIDLQQPVKYQAQRIENPDRIFFDLYGARLDRALYGKSFDVDDGFLKKIRIAQYAAERARVVLDLDESTDYRASIETNPPRLIIDIRNKDIRNRQLTSPPEVKEASLVKPDAANPRTKAPKAKAIATAPCVDDQDSDDESSSSAGCDDDSKPALDAAKLDAPVLKTEAAKPAKRIVVNSNGVKKTIVDAADDDDTTVAKLDPPDVVPASKAPAPPAPELAGKSSLKKSRRPAPSDALEIHEAQPNADGDRSLTRALGLKIGKIVIDPGHGGHDTGTIGPNGLEEKDLVLDVSLRLGKLLASRLGSQVVFTRKDDTFIPLEDRTAIANHESADLFVSVHANSSRDPDARGVETYYLNFSSSPDALEVAARENAVSEKSIHELQDLVKKIALKEKIEESHEFAGDVESALHAGLAVKNPGLRDRGVKKAPFIVLIGANMPSILAEISFVSNPSDERRLRTPEYRQKIAESLYRGIAKYVNGLSGVKLASKIDKGQGQ
jgi:N-acetylmuramoyl-L-alanine amidase